MDRQGSHRLNTMAAPVALRSSVLADRLGLPLLLQPEAADRGIDAYVATGRERHHRAGIGGGIPAGTPLRSAMRDKLRTPEGRAVYARRKTITEPVFGCIKQARGFRQFLLRVGAGVVGRIHPGSPHPVEAVARWHGGHRVATGVGNNGYVSWNLMADRVQGPKTPGWMENHLRNCPSPTYPSPESSDRLLGNLAPENFASVALAGVQ